ncbi:4-hydroxy-tetrahydrodipicolinate synthase [Streptomyces fuscichromogenes]|uniref:4-hydroxy-tetrahydrodipicolinate synthase n=1 Tax=Streptomyces fuscichromogenes TaxID=1324013 RepID=A0A918CT64_9ACTN|nr:4-hydroxy-tetrahydrodipicolinate synthase [Streptomyces fuscichromogenes]GGN22804.1 4-hydroxy-tetrahydrodipicolinate synthase [Streptomyces fuscichromogenes]
MKFRSDPARLRGAFTALVTPFTPEFDVDLDGLRSFCRWQLANGSHGLSIGGSTGEPGVQSVDERVAAMRVVAEETADGVPFLPGTGSLKLDETLALTGAAQDLGADAALVVTPYYARPTQEALYQWYSRIAREYPDLPLVVYNVPVRTSVEIAPETVYRLRRDHDNIVGIKETTKDFEHFSHVYHLCGRDFLMWSGIELLCLPLLALGGTGFISALSNLAPGAVAQMYDHYAAGRHEQATELHYRLHPLVDLLFVETNPAPAKWLLEQQGVLPSGAVRPPLIPPTETGRQQILSLFDQARGLVPGPLEVAAR